MHKNLVQRSKFQKFIVADGAPVTQLVQGDEVFVYAYPPDTGHNAGSVIIERQAEREWKKLFPDNLPDEIFPTIATDGKRWPLCGRSGSPLSAIGNGLADVGVNLLTGFSDNVTFSVLEGVAGAVTVIVETIHYEVRK